MNAAQTMPSPVSPYEAHAKQQQAFSAQKQYYPASPHTDNVSPQQYQATNRGLGLYPGSIPAPNQSTISPIMASPQSDWSHSSQHPEQQEYPSQPPDIFSAAFDPFSNFPANNSSGVMGAPSPEAPGLEFCQTPPSSNMQSHRGSVSSSYAASEGSHGAYTPRAVKAEEAGGEWYPASGNDIQRAITQAPLSYTPGSATLASQTEDLYRSPQADALYRPQPAEWSKNDTAGYLTELQNSADGSRGLPRFDMQPVLSSAARIKKKRQRTTPEEATHECRVCGKLFKRSYNWKSHMETHNPERKYPHPCTHMVGSSQCSKKFQRKTDLDRHVESVHMKARNHKCNLCGNRFARRDTLRRHTEDGCPKRFELTIRDQQTQLTALQTVHQQQPQQQQQQPQSAHSAPQPQRWSFPSPVTGFDTRPRSFSQSMAPPPQGPNHYPVPVYPHTAAAPTYPS